MNRTSDNQMPEAASGDKGLLVQLERWRAFRQRFTAWASSPSGRSWVEAAEIWLCTRVVFLLLTYLVPTLLTKVTRAPAYLATIHRWTTQDGAFYVAIAQHGYTAAWRTNFWPLFPLLGHVLGPAFGGDDSIALMVVSNLAFFGALVVLHRLAARELGDAVAFRTVLYLAVFPTAFYTFAPYTESLFLCLAIASFALIRGHGWWLAGLLGGLAAATRSSGVLLLAPFAVEFYLAWRAGSARLYHALAGLLIPAGTGAYCLYLALRFHDPLVFLRASSADLRHTFTWPWQLPGQIVEGARQLGTSSALRGVHFVLNLAITLAFVALTIVIWRKLPFAYTAYTLAFFLYLLLFSASTPTLAVTGDGRYMLMIFPAFMVLAMWGKRRWFHHALLIGMLPLLAILCAHYLLALAPS